jgi:nitrite reductase/ring-hydroxylating ferredoxin subunit
MPMTVVNYALTPTEQTYYSTLGPFVLVVHTRLSSAGAGRTRADTTYNVAAPGMARFAFPLIKRILKKNYEVLMSEDRPMRDRRGELRRKGFTFLSDGRSRTFPETMSLGRSNVVPPAGESSVTPIAVPLSTLARDGDQAHVGEDDHRGVRLVRQGKEILAFPRMCPHEGASLDCAAVAYERISCPWHARQFLPSTRVRIEDGSSAEGDQIILEIHDGNVNVHVLG